MPKIIYKESDGTIRTAGYFKDDEALLPGEVIKDFDGEIPNGRCDLFKFVDGKIEEKTDSEKEIYLEKEKKFSEQSFSEFIDSIPSVDEKIEILKKAVSKLAPKLLESDFKK